MQFDPGSHDSKRFRCGFDLQELDLTTIRHGDRLTLEDEVRRTSQREAAGPLPLNFIVLDSWSFDGSILVAIHQSIEIIHRLLQNFQDLIPAMYNDRFIRQMIFCVVREVLR